jgi:hypothetical protein
MNLTVEIIARRGSNGRFKSETHCRHNSLGNHFIFGSHSRLHSNIGKNMFYADSIVDTIQNGKHQFIKNYIHNQELADAWTKFVETQSIFCHTAVKVTDLMFQKMTEPQGPDWLQATLDSWPQGNSPK